MDESDFLALVAEIELISDKDAFLSIKEKILFLCSVYGKYAYELKIVLEKQGWGLGIPPEGWHLITFERITFPTFSVHKNSQALLAYNMPISKIIEENSIKDIQDDEEFALHVDQAGVHGDQGGDRSLH